VQFCAACVPVCSSGMLTNWATCARCRTGGALVRPAFAFLAGICCGCVLKFPCRARTAAGNFDVRLPLVISEVDVTH
jgi:hypothetical protein